MTKATQQQPKATAEAPKDPMPFLVLDHQDEEHVIEIEGLGKLTLLQRNSLSYNEEEATFTAFETIDGLTKEGKSVREVNLALYLPIVVMLMRRSNPEISEAMVKDKVPTAFWEPAFNFFLVERNGGKAPESGKTEGKDSADEKPEPSSKKRTAKSSGD